MRINNCTYRLPCYLYTFSGFYLWVKTKPNGPML